ncbi:MAG TPA: hypothetical protein PLK63_01385 [Catalimonadaceae bacterium]|nr:hypothetical protein [Catalimonadaceae bacterium]
MFQFKTAFLSLLHISIWGAQSIGQSPQHVVYYTNFYLGQHHFMDSSYAKSDSCFRIAFALDSVQGFNQDYLMAAVNAHTLGDSRLAGYYLQRFSMRGGTYRNVREMMEHHIYLQQKSDAFRKFIYLPQNKRLRKTMDSCFRVYKSNVNKPLIARINRIGIKDQRYRTGWRSIFVSGKRRWRKIRVLDLENRKEFLEICAEYGWPGFHLLGEFRETGRNAGTGQVEVLIRHADGETLKKLEPYALDAIRKLDLYPEDWASAIDYCRIREPFNSDSTYWEHCQKYGWFGGNNWFGAEPGAIYPFGKAEVNKADRTALFLCPIEDYAKLRGWKLPVHESWFMPKQPSGKPKL